MRPIIPVGITLISCFFAACNPFVSGERDFQEITSLRDKFEANPSDRSTLDEIVRRTLAHNTLTRSNAVAVLGEITLDRDLRPKVIETTLPVFIHSLNDAEQPVRHSAIDALSGLGSSATAALPALRALLTDHDSFISTIAKTAIERIELGKF